jgi:hypothetical protein
MISSGEATGARAKGKNSWNSTVIKISFIEREPDLGLDTLGNVCNRLLLVPDSFKSKVIRR